MKNISTWDLQAIEVMVSLAVVRGDPLYADLPKIMIQVTAPLKEQMTKHLRRLAVDRFGPDVGNWVGENYARINECSYRLCHEFTVHKHNTDYHAPSLDAHLLAEVGDNLKFVSLFLLVSSTI